MTTLPVLRWMPLSALCLSATVLLSGCGGGSGSTGKPDEVPSISLIGDAYTKVKLGDNAYKDAGALATDQKDGDLTDQIVVGGDVVDVNQPGVYTVRYFVKDSDSNTARITRTVRVADYGAMDTSFGTDGLTQIDSDLTTHTIASDNNGDIFMSGNDASRIAIVKYSSSGVPDTTFGTNGIVTYSHPTASTNTFAKDIEIGANNQIFVAGRIDPSDNNDSVAVWKYQPDGSLDTGFGTSGLADTNQDSDRNNFFIAMDAAGNIYATGSDKHTFIMKFDANGDLDPNFGTDGINIIDNESREEISGIALDSSGNIYISGEQSKFVDGNLITSGSLWKFNPDGQLVDDFGNAGQVIFTQNGYRHHFTSLAIDNNDQIYLTGHRYNYPTGDRIEEMIVLKYDTRGQLVNDFGDQGLVVYKNETDGHFGTKIKIGQDDSIYIAGDIIANEVFAYSEWRYKIAVWQYNRKGQLMPHFGDQGVAMHDLKPETTTSETTYDLLIDEDQQAIYLSASEESTYYLIKLIN
ncbi:immunoglobulin-like domain-containing protein [Oceanospirillum sp. HFRX-1_2]